MKYNKSYILKNIYGTMNEFYINENDDLICNKFSEEIKILENVSEFNINITYLGIIEIICITCDGLIKYCKFNRKWSIQTLYKLKSSSDKIKEISLFSKSNNLHIFFIFYKDKVDSLANILHYVWNGNKFKTNIVTSVNLIDNINKHYYLETVDNTINMFYITKEKNYNIINYCKYTNNSWTHSKKLYRLNGTNINFSTLKKNKEFNILNLSKERKTYTLEHVILDNKDTIKSFPIYNTNNYIDKATFITFNDILYCMWVECDTLMYSSFNQIKWSDPFKIDCESFDNIDIYRYIYEQSPWDNSLKTKNIFASISSDINIFLPKITKTYNNKNNETCDAEGTIRKLLQEISERNTLNYKLKNKAVLLTEKLKVKNIHINDLSEKTNKISIEKSTLENKYKSILELNNKIKVNNQDFKDNINTKSEKIELLKIRLNEKINENEKLKQGFIEKDKESGYLNTEFNGKIEKLNNIIKNLEDQNTIIAKNSEHNYNTQIQDIKKQLQEKQNQFNDLLNKNKNLEKSIKELKLENNNINKKLETSRNNILLEFQNKYNVETSNIKKQLQEKEKSFGYITDYTEKLETTLEELKSENSLIKQQLENSKNKSFIERILGKPYK